jgi:hypothetical protein
MAVGSLLHGVSVMTPEDGGAAYLPRLEGRRHMTWCTHNLYFLYTHLSFLSRRPREATRRANPNPTAGPLPLLLPHPAAATSRVRLKHGLHRRRRSSPRPLAHSGGAGRRLGPERGVAVGHHDGADRRHGRISGIVRRGGGGRWILAGFCRRWWPAGLLPPLPIRIVPYRPVVSGPSGDRWWRQRSVRLVSGAVASFSIGGRRLGQSDAQGTGWSLCMAESCENPRSRTLAGADDCDVSYILKASLR